MASICSKKGQIGMVETIMVLVVVVLILSIGIFYYYNFYIKDIEETGERLSSFERDILLASVLKLPEIQCSFNTVNRNCIDINKVETGFISENQEDYFEKFGSKRIIIREIYPGDGEWTIYNRPKPNFESKEIVSVVVSLYFSEDEYRVGRLVIEDLR